MTTKVFFVFCAQVFLIKSIYGQCPGRVGSGLLAGSVAAPLAGSLAGPALRPLAVDSCGGVASTGGGFAVTSSSPIAPVGVTVVSENAIEGALAAGGNLPLLGSVAVEGAFQTAGAGAVSYGCGNGEVTIASEGPISTGILAPGPVGPSPVLAAAPAFAPALAGPTFGLGRAGGAIAPGLLGARAGTAPGLGRGIGCGTFY